MAISKGTNMHQNRKNIDLVAGTLKHVLSLWNAEARKHWEIVTLDMHISITRFSVFHNWVHEVIRGNSTGFICMHR